MVTIGHSVSSLVSMFCFCEVLSSLVLARSGLIAMHRLCTNIDLSDQLEPGKKCACGPLRNVFEALG